MPGKRPLLSSGPESSRGCGLGAPRGLGPAPGGVSAGPGGLGYGGPAPGKRPARCWEELPPGVEVPPDFPKRSELPRRLGPRRPLPGRPAASWPPPAEGGGGLSPSPPRCPAMRRAGPAPRHRTPAGHRAIHH